MKKKNTAKKTKLTKEEKKQALKARKLARKQKKLAKENRYHLYDPVKMKAFRFSQLLGYLLRFFAIGFSIFGVCILVCDAFLLTEVHWAPLLLYCFGAVTAFSLIFIGRLYILAGLGIIGAYVGLFYALAGNLHTFFISGVEELVNRVMTRLADRGFAAIDPISLPDFGGIERETVVYGGVFALATVLAVIFAAFSAKRTRLTPMLIFGGGLCVVCFTYNLCSSNWGIACALAGLCSAIVLSAYDKIYKKHKKSRKSRAYSGYAAALAGILAMAILLVPTLTIKDEFMEITAISEQMEYARTIVTTILTGGNPKYNKMNTLNKEFSAEIEDFEPTGAYLFSVGSASSKRNIYLRSWIGDSFSSSKDSWSVLDEDAYKEMLKELQGEPNKFTGDYITTLLYQLSDPKATSFDSESGYYSNKQYGFVSTYVNVEYVKNTGLLYVLPSAYNSMLGLLEFESTTDRYRQKYDVYSDGIMESTWLNLRKSYSSMAIIPSYIESDYAENAELMAAYYDLLVRYVTEDYLMYSNSQEVLDAFSADLAALGITDSKSTEPLAEYLALSQSQKTTWRRKNITLISTYSSYVKDYYTSYEATEGLRAVYDEIAPSVEAAETTHDKLMCVIDYLVKNYEYSQTPAKPSGQYDSDLDAFLLETKSGYCVQFATAATLLFRMFGFPARYVQGYVATDFHEPEYYMTSEEREAYEESEEKSASKYISRVTDENAHAWVEVYIDGLGWRTYEPTPVYYINLYEYKSELSGALDEFDDTIVPPPESEVTTTLPEEEEPDTDPEEEEKEEEEKVMTFDVRFLITTLIIIIVAGALLALILWHIRRVRKVVEGRAHYIERSVYGIIESREEKEQIASVLCDSVYEVQSILGFKPMPGEAPSEFAYRVDHPDLSKASKAELRQHARMALLPSTFTEITVLIEKHEFGKALTREELAKLGEYMSELHKNEYAKLPFIKKLWYRYFRFMI